MHEALIGAGFLIIYLLRFYKSQYLNNSCIGKSNASGNIRLVAAVYLPESFPPRSDTFVSIAQFEANLDELIEFGKQDSIDIDNEAKLREAELGTSNLAITLGASLDLKVRHTNYFELLIYQAIDSLNKLRPSPPHFKYNII
jgi:hypothetical protein